MRLLYPYLMRLFLLMLLIGKTSFSNAQDLPGASPDLQTAPVGTLVIAMDNTNQATSSINTASGTYFFNLKAYGLAVLLRNAGIYTRWVITSGKAKDGIDFSAAAERMYPSYVAPQTLSFSSGPILIYPSDTLGVDYLINWYNYSHPDSSKVKVYRLTEEVQVDVRYTLSTPPRIAILHDSCDIHQNFMGMASVPTVNYNCLANTSYGLISGCYTMVTMPHMDANDLQSYDDDSIYNFVMAGGNMLAACESVQTFENITRYHSATGILDEPAANDGFGNMNNFNSVGNVFYDNPDMAYAQFEGAFRPRVRGALQMWRYMSGTINNFYSVVSCKRSAPDDLYYVSGVSKLRSGLGGLAFYLGNHEYYTFECKTCNSSISQSEQEINGIRMYLNAIMMPTELLPCVVLDVRLGEFTAIRQNNKTVLVKWSTHSEINNDFFIIEHSTNGKNFAPVGKQFSTGNSNQGYNYHFIHANPSEGINYYRLRSVDKDGTAEYSSIRKVVFGKNNFELTVFPNPARNKAMLMIDLKDHEKLFVNLIDGAGRIVKQQVLTIKGQLAELELSDVRNGLYIIVAKTERGDQFKNKLIINQ